MEFSYFLGSPLPGERHNVHLKNTLLLNFGIKKEEVICSSEEVAAVQGTDLHEEAAERRATAASFSSKKINRTCRKQLPKTQRDKELSLIIIQQLKGKLSADKAPRIKKK